VVSSEWTARAWTGHHYCNEQERECRPATLPICPQHRVPFRVLIGERIGRGRRSRQLVASVDQAPGKLWLGIQGVINQLIINVSVRKDVARVVGAEH
jgi:hypothetical protein